MQCREPIDGLACSALLCVVMLQSIECCLNCYIAHACNFCALERMECKQCLQVALMMLNLDA
jgi:hypothetical protein